MPAFMDLTGQTFGRLTVLARAANRGQFVAWRCGCVCGTEKVVRAADLSRGTVASCGCLRRETTARMGRAYTKPQVDLTGQRFGRLVALDPARAKSGGAGWRCRCDCGGESVVVSNWLTSGNSRSCGCLRVDVAHTNKKHLVHGKGPEHHKWRSDLTAADRGRRRHAENRDWSRAVLERDGFRCQVCRGGGRMNAHHIAPFATEKHLRLDLDNGICLCVACHKNFHRRFGWKGFSAADFETYRLLSIAA